MEIYSIKPYFQKVLSPLANLFVKLKIHPTIINLMALIFSICTGVFLFFKNDFYSLLLFVPVLVFIRIAFNALDGMVARGLNVSSAKGEVYNEFFDRLSDIFIFTGLAFSFILTRDRIVSFLLSFRYFSCINCTLKTAIAVNINFILGFIFIILVLLNSYLGILAKSAGGKRIYAGILGKADRMFYLAAACVVYYFIRLDLIWFIFYLLCIIAIIVSIGQRLCKSVKSLKDI